MAQNCSPELWRLRQEDWEFQNRVNYTVRLLKKTVTHLQKSKQPLEEERGVDWEVGKSKGITECEENVMAPAKQVGCSCKLCNLSCEGAETQGRLGLAAFKLS